MSRVLLIFLLACVVPNVRSQDSFPQEEEIEADDILQQIPHELVAPEDLKTTRDYQGEDIPLRRFDEQKWKAIVGDLDYSERPVEKKEREPFSVPWAGPVLKVVAYAVIIGLVVFLLYYITKKMTFDQRIERNKLQTDDLEKPVENIDSLEIDALLEKARREGDFRMVIRLYFLGLLKKLNAAGLIVWQKDKTNRDYLSELYLKDFHYREIQRLTVSYEAVWYGEHTLRGESLERLTKEFEGAYRELNTDIKQ
jgi:hypothetical protein